ncbi:MAG TPA: hypothetical protein VHP12_04140 [Chitinophagaceae bacterium]|nr:hypothetical protein [Chitinophagaceae bacterium]
MQKKLYVHVVDVIQTNKITTVIIDSAILHIFLDVKSTVFKMARIKFNSINAETIKPISTINTSDSILLSKK